MKETVKIYRWKDFPFDEFISRYRTACTERDEPDWLNAHITVGDFKEEMAYREGKISLEELEAAREKDLAYREDVPTVHMAASKEVKSDDLIKEKVLFLQHLIIKRVETNKNGSRMITLSSSLLKAVLGYSYAKLLEVLHDMKYFAYDRDSFEGQAARIYVEDRPIECCEVSNFGFQKLEEKMATELKKWREQQKRERIGSGVVSEDFYGSYTTSLNKFKLRDKEAFKIKLDNDDSRRKIYNEYVYEAALSKKEILSIDEQGRIYHLLTNLKRGYKKYFNIRYSIDCKNSHPLLFNYFIFYFNNISNKVSYSISHLCKELRNEFDIEDSNILHYFGNYLYNALINSNIRKSEFANISKDELLYIFLTSNGLLWNVMIRWAKSRQDIISEIQKGIDQNLNGREQEEELRAQVKQIMFAEVFYSNNPYLYRNKTTGEMEKKFAEHFKELFPTVYELISKFKKLHLEESITAYLDASGVIYQGNPRSSLSRAMMRLEATIFRDVLTSIYRKRKAAINIHDCIVVPDVSNAPDEGVVLDLMEKEYKKYGLCPTFSVDE